jgi:hypothetical protein
MTEPPDDPRFRVEIVKSLNEARAKLGLPPFEWKSPVGPPPPPPPPKTWQESPDLLDPQRRAVLGMHMGKGTDVPAVESALGHPIEMQRWYFKDFGDNFSTVVNNTHDIGRTLFAEIEWTTMFGNAGVLMQDPQLGSLCYRISKGRFDEWIRAVLTQLAAPGVPMLASMWHEVDLDNEQRYYPKGQKAPGNSCGTNKEIAAAWRRVVEIIYEIGAQEIILPCWIMSSGVSDWEELFPGEEGITDRQLGDLPAGSRIRYVRRVGFDPYNWFGVKGGDGPLNWTSFQKAFWKFNRPNLLRKLAPNTPIAIGETATCQSGYVDSKGKSYTAPQTAGDWITDLFDFVVEWNADADSGYPMIANVSYFSMDYGDHNRSASQPEHLAGWASVGTHDGWAWAADERDDLSSLWIPFNDLNTGVVESLAFMPTSHEVSDAEPTAIFVNGREMSNDEALVLYHQLGDWLMRTGSIAKR